MTTALFFGIAFLVLAYLAWQQLADEEIKGGRR